MAQKYKFFNSRYGDRKYGAADWADYFHTLVANGVGTETQTELKASANGLTITLQPGRAFVNGYMYTLDEPMTLTLTAPTTNPRIDNIVIRVDHAARTMFAASVTGTEAQSPVAPTPTRDSSAYELVLARARISTAGTVSLTDTRADTNLCGWCGWYVGNKVSYDMNDMNERLRVLKARMDTFSSLTNGSTTGDAELTGIRVRADGVTSATAGESVREQFKMARASDYAVYEHVQDAALWANAYYKGTDGSRGNSTTMLALVTDTFLPEGWGLLTADPTDAQNIGFRLFGWDQNGDYAGIWNPNTCLWGSSLARSNQSVRINLDEVRAMYPGYMFKVCATGNSSDFTMPPETYGTYIHVWEKRVDETPKDIDWGWTIGGLNGETGFPNGATGRIRSYHIPCGAGTRLTFTGVGYAGMQVYEYDSDWTYKGSSGEMVRRWTVRTDGFIRVSVAKSDGSAIASGEIATLGALVSCVNYIPPRSEAGGELFRRWEWVMATLYLGGVAGAINSLVTRDIQRFPRDTALDFDPAAYRAAVSYYDDDGNYLDQTDASTAATGRGRICIPAGANARIMLAAVASSAATPALAAAYTVREEDGLIWYGGQSTLGAFLVSPQKIGLITASVRYSGRGLTVRCTDPTYRVRWTGYDSGDWNAPAKRSVGLASAAYIDPNCYYRVQVRRADEAEIDDAERPAALAQLVWEREEDIGPGIAAAGAAALERIDVGEVPSYYASHIAAKAAAINALRTDTAVQFALITDYHINQYDGNTNHSGALLQYLADNTMMDFVLNCGDVASGLSLWDGDATDQALFRLLVRQACAYMSPRGVPTYFVAGNHDGGISGRTTYGQLISAEEVYRISGLQAMRGVVQVDPASPYQYYWDDTAHGMRFIAATLGLTDVLTGESGANGFKFLAKALKDTPDGYGIIVFLHMVLQIPGTAMTTRGAQLAQMCANYNARLDTAIDGYPATAQDYSGCTGRVLAIIGGHSHFDWSGTAGGGERTVNGETVTVEGVPVIVTTCDCAGGQGIVSDEGGQDPRPTGGIEEQAFDVFTVEPATGVIHATRIGGGSTTSAERDRSWGV